MIAYDKLKQWIRGPGYLLSAFFLYGIGERILFLVIWPDPLSYAGPRWGDDLMPLYVPALAYLGVLPCIAAYVFALLAYFKEKTRYSVGVERALGRAYSLVLALLTVLILWTPFINSAAERSPGGCADPDEAACGLTWLGHMGFISLIGWLFLPMAVSVLLGRRRRWSVVQTILGSMSGIPMMLYLMWRSFITMKA